MSASASNKEQWPCRPGRGASNSRLSVCSYNKPHSPSASIAKKENQGCSAGVADRSESTHPALGAPVKLAEGLDVAFNSSPCAARAMAAALSAQAAAGATAAKVSKRRSRAAAKTPITVLSADTTNFRAMVQKLTGIPSPPPMQRNGFQFWGSSGLSVSTAFPFRTSHGMPGLDTSGFLLSDGASSTTQSSKLLPNESLVFSSPLAGSQRSSLAAELGLNRSRGHFTRSTFSHEVNSPIQSLLPGNSSNSRSCASLPSLWDPAEGDCFTDKLRDSSLNGRLLGEAVVGRNGNNKQAGEADRLSVRSDCSDLHFAGRSY